jgi:hypothetical protein
MIVATESSEGHLVITGRRTNWRRMLLAALLTSALLLAEMSLLIGGIYWLTTRGAPLSGIPSELLWGALLLAALPWGLAAGMLGESERIELHDRTLTYEHRLFGVRTGRDEYNLFAVKGLRLVQGLQFWYHGRIPIIGTVLSQADAREAMEAMLKYDERLRRGLAMDPALGLAFTDVWTSEAARQDLLQEIYSYQPYLG